MVDRSRLALLGHAAARFVPAIDSGPVTYRIQEPRGLSWSVEEFRRAAEDEARPVGERLGAAELYWLGSALRRESLGGDAFERHFEVLVSLVDALPEEPAFAALATDALRAHREVVGPAGDSEDATRERFLAREVVRLCVRVDPDNGYFDLFAAEVAVADARVEEARQSLVLAARAPIVDSRLRTRSAAAHAFLSARGLPELETREFLLDDAYTDSNYSSGELLERLAAELGRFDTSAAGGDDDRWMETFLAIHECGLRLAEAALLKIDARQALAAANVYLDAIRAGATARAVAIPRVGEGGRGVRAMVECLAAAGYTHGASAVEESVRGERAALRAQASSRTRSRRGSELVLPLTAAHGILVSWALLAWAAGLLLLPWARPWVRKTRAEKAKSLSLPGLDFLAAVAPFLLIVWMGHDGIFPLDQPIRRFEWISIFGGPPPFVVLLPLLSAVVLALPHLAVAAHRNLRSFAARASGFFLVLGCVFFLGFAVTTPILERLRGIRQAELAGLVSQPAVVDGRPAWPAVSRDDS